MIQVSVPQTRYHNDSDTSCNRKFLPLLLQVQVWCVPSFDMSFRFLVKAFCVRRLGWQSVCHNTVQVPRWRLSIFFIWYIHIGHPPFKWPGRYLWRPRVAKFPFRRSIHLNFAHPVWLSMSAVCDLRRASLSRSVVHFKSVNRLILERCFLLQNIRERLFWVDSVDGIDMSWKKKLR